MAAAFVPLPRHCLAATDATNATAEPASTTSTPDQQVAALLNKLRQQILAGHTTSPPSDNAVETWVQVDQLTRPRLSAGAAKALDDFVQTAHTGEASARAEGRDAVALDLSVFADFATSELKDRSADNESRPVAPPAPPMPPAPREHAISVELRTASVRGAPGAHDGGAAAASAGAPQATTTQPADTPSTRPKAAALATSQPAAAADPALTAAYLNRGDQMLAIKDISAARGFFDYAARAGNARAAAKLAQTYDPDFLHRIGVVGLQPDVAKAVTLYRQAAALGDTEAQTRLRVLNQEAVR